MLTGHLSRFVASTRFKDLPPEVVTAAKWAILDHIGVVLAGSQQAVAAIINSLITEYQASPESTVIKSNLQTNCSLAALANGTFSHALDYDDCLDFPTLGLGHPTTVIMPAVMAVAEKLGATGKALISAYCAGTEVYGKVGLLLGKKLGGGWVRTSVLGAIGAAAGIANMLGLDEYQVGQGFGIAASFAGGLQRNFGTMVNPLHSGYAARTGVEAALLAGRGFTSRDGILEAPGGFYNVFTGTLDGVPEKTEEEIGNSLGSPWNIVSPGLMFKIYPCAHIAHFGVDAGLYLRKERSVDWRSITELEFRVPANLLSGVYREPKTGLEGKFSLGYCLSRALIDGAIKIIDFTDERVAEPQVKQLMAKIKWTALEPQAGGGAFGYQEVIAQLDNGLTHAIKIEHPKGEPENPPTSDEIIAKYEDCAEYAGLDKKVISQVKELILNLEKVEKISQLTSLIK